MIKSDFHVHTSFSTDSDTPAREQIEALINKGITEICITDHHDIGYTAMEKADVNTSESTNTNIESRPFRINPFAYYEAILGLIPEYSDRARISIGISFFVSAHLYVLLFGHPQASSATIKVLSSRFNAPT